MSVLPRYRANAGAVFSLKYHLVCCPKYRRSVLVPPVDARLKQLVAEAAGEHGVSIHAIEVMPDHVHLFVEADPPLRVAEIAYRRKGACSRVLHGEFPHFRSQLTTLRNRSDYANSAGAVSDAVGRCFIEAQKGV